MKRSIAWLGILLLAVAAGAYFMSRVVRTDDVAEPVADSLSAEQIEAIEDSLDAFDQSVLDSLAAADVEH